MLKSIATTILTSFITVNASANPFWDWDYWKTATAESVERHIRNGVDVKTKNKYNTTVLMVASGFSGNPDVISTLVSYGADVNARNKYNETALIWAGWSNKNPDIISRLIKHGADIEAKDKYGETALIVASRKNENPYIIARLINHGANIYAKGRYDRTAWYYIKTGWSVKRKKTFLGVSYDW